MKNPGFFGENLFSLENLSSLPKLSAKLWIKLSETDVHGVGVADLFRPKTRFVPETCDDSFSKSV